MWSDQQLVAPVTFPVSWRPLSSENTFTQGFIGLSHIIYVIMYMCQSYLVLFLATKSLSKSQSQRFFFFNFFSGLLFFFLSQDYFLCQERQIWRTINSLCHYRWSHVRNLADLVAYQLISCLESPSLIFSKIFSLQHFGMSFISKKYF